MPDERDSPGRDDAGGFDDDISDATVVEEFAGGVIAQYGQRIAAVAQHLGRFGDSLGGLAIDLRPDGDASQHAAALTTVHAHGMNAARYLREALEHVTAANELIGKAARRARALVPPAPR